MIRRIWRVICYYLLDHSNTSLAVEDRFQFLRNIAVLILSDDPCNEIVFRRVNRIGTFRISVHPNASQIDIAKIATVIEARDLSPIGREGGYWRHQEQDAKS